MLIKCFSRRPILRLVYFLVVAFLIILSCEALARPLWNKKYADWFEKSVHLFGYFDREKLVERYTPGYKRTAGEILSDLKASGRVISYKQTKAFMEKYGINSKEPAFQINQFGLKGPEIAVKPKAGVVRVLTVGDSCTFGPYIDKFSYPRQLERMLNGLKGKQYEVINAGHLGYNLQQVLNLLDEWLLFEPEIVTIYIGWNRTIERGDPRKNDGLYDRFALYRFIYHGVINRTNVEGYKTFATGQFDLKTREMARLKDKIFAVDLKYLKKIVTKIQERSSKTKIVLITLPGLYDVHAPPTAEEISVGYATAFTPNLAAWAVLSEHFNEDLRSFGQKNHLVILDLAKYAQHHFHPKLEYFADPVHLTPRGHLQVAELLFSLIQTEKLR